MKIKSSIRNLWSSITNFEMYQEYATEKKSDTLIYFAIMIAIFSFAVSLIYVINVHTQICKISRYIENNINEVAYSENKLSVNKNERMLIEDKKNYILVNTDNIEENQIKEYEEKLSDRENGVVVLNSKVLIKSSDSVGIVSFEYKDLIASNESYSFNKQDLYNMLNGSEIIKFYIILIIITDILMFFVCSVSTLMYAIILALVGKMSCLIIRLPMQAKSLLSIAIHALTLPMLLQVIYFAVNLYTGFTINYFQVMYCAVAYIYIITAILIIKSDYMKNQVELSNIKNEQKKVRDEHKDN